MTDLCPLDHERPARLDLPMTVCTWHHDAAERAIAELPGLYEFLGRRLIGSGGSGLSGMPSGSKEPGISLNHRVVQVRTDIHNNLTAWARVAVDERHLTHPADTIPACAAFILTHLTWFTTKPFARQLVNDVTDDHATALRLADPNHVRSFEVGDCPEPGCEGRLIARIRPKDSLLPHDVTCDVSPEDEDGNLTHIWPADKWMTLGRRVARQATA